jgi:hypothetical protein
VLATNVMVAMRTITLVLLGHLKPTALLAGAMPIAIPSKSWWSVPA